MPQALVIGSGPNGLAAAITLARAGVSTEVLEAQETIGGGVRSAELTLPGFVHDRCSAVHPLAVASPFFRELPLERYGLRWVQPPVAVAHPLDDGTAAALRMDLDESSAALGRDGAAYRRLMQPFVQQWPALIAEFLQPLLHVPRHPFLMARFGVLGLRSATSLARAHFETEAARALFAGLAAHSFLPLEAPGSASFGLVLGLTAHAVGWPSPEGGAQRITDALAAHLRELGGSIVTGRKVADLRECTRAEATLLDLTAWPAARLAGTGWPEHYRAKLAHFPHAPAAFKIDYALSAPIPWRAAVCRKAGTVHLGGRLEEIALAERQIARGEVPGPPFVLLAQPSLFDPSRAPAGRHTAWAYAHIPRGCTLDFTEAIERQIERFAPGFRDCILARAVASAPALESTNANLEGGDISGGANTLWRLLERPTLSFTPYRTPTRGLYLRSASTPPGGGVHGMCGFHAAQAALKRELRTRQDPS